MQCQLGLFGAPCAQDGRSLARFYLMVFFPEGDDGVNVLDRSVSPALRLPNFFGVPATFLDEVGDVEHCGLVVLSALPAVCLVGRELPRKSNASASCRFCVLFKLGWMCCESIGRPVFEVQCKESLGGGCSRACLAPPPPLQEIDRYVTYVNKCESQPNWQHTTTSRET
jgi:hypothetical protein